jgi:nicotinamide phosphoribosyltransferase
MAQWQSPYTIEDNVNEREVLISYLRDNSAMMNISPKDFTSFRPSIIFLVDYYKHSHSRMYYPDVQYAMSYAESRGISKEHEKYVDTMIWNGMQYYIKRYLSGVVVTKEDIDYVEELCIEAFGNNEVFDRTLWEAVISDYGGKLPLAIHSLPEGLRVKPHTVLFKIKNYGGKRFVSLVSFVETLLQNTWYPSAVLTLDFHAHEYMRAAYRKSVDDSDFESYKYMINDFGVRGTSCPEEAMIGGMAHFMLSYGSDNVPAHSIMNSIYPRNKETKIVGTAMASEHFVVTMLGQEDEYKIFAHCMNVYPKGILSMVSDGFNIFNAVEKVYGEKLAKEVTERDGTLVIRLDSGAPIPTILTVLSKLADKFGTSTNTKGYKVLPPFIRIMQSDGINYRFIKEILDTIMEHGYAANNIVFGYGGDLLRKVNRDTLKFAIKCCQVTRLIDGDLVNIGVQKKPVEMNENYELIESFKESKMGEYKTINYNGEIISVPVNDEKYSEYEDMMVLTFDKGNYLEYTLEEVRETVEKQFRN